jgi:hypothetical protein
MLCHPSRLEEFDRTWQKIYGDRKGAEIEAANYEMIIRATKKGEEEWDAAHTDEEI